MCSPWLWEVIAALKDEKEIRKVTGYVYKNLIRICMGVLTQAEIDRLSKALFKYYPFLLQHTFHGGGQTIFSLIEKDPTLSSAEKRLATLNVMNLVEAIRVKTNTELEGGYNFSQLQPLPQVQAGMDVEAVFPVAYATT
jgi:hypothetical protein